MCCHNLLRVCTAAGGNDDDCFNGQKMKNIMKLWFHVCNQAVCNMVVAALIKRTGFEKMAFGQNHPGGNIGQRLGTAKAIS